MDKFVKVRELLIAPNYKFSIFKTTHKNEICFEARLYKRILFLWVEAELNYTHSANCYRSWEFDKIMNFIKNYEKNQYVY
mgnify:CR=1 FL=1